MRPIAIVGDVHGEMRALGQMLQQLDALDRPVLFVGDYINGGPDSARVIEELANRKLSNSDRWRFLAGNHDLALLDYLNKGDFSEFAALGGVATLASYLPHAVGDLRTQFGSVFPPHHCRFLETLSPYFEDDDVFVSHVGFSPDDLFDRSLDALVRLGDKRVFSVKGPRNLVVCGHYLQTTRRPFETENLICLDTGCGTIGGPLTAVLLPEREFILIPSRN